MVKLITYDLRKPEKSEDYNKLIDEIKKYPRWCKLTESCWVINTVESCSAVVDHLSKFLDANDRLFVGALKNDAAWISIICNSEYLKTSLIDS